MTTTKERPRLTEAQVYALGMAVQMAYHRLEFSESELQDIGEQITT